MRHSLSLQSSSLSLRLRLLTTAIALTVMLKQRFNRVWQSLTSRFCIRTDYLRYQPMDWELDPEDWEIWAAYLDDPSVTISCAEHLERCIKNPSAKHHGH